MAGRADDAIVIEINDDAIQRLSENKEVRVKYTDDTAILIRRVDVQEPEEMDRDDERRPGVA